MSVKGMIVKFSVPMYAVIPEDNYLYKPSLNYSDDDLKEAFVSSVVKNPQVHGFVTKALDKGCMRRGEDNKMFMPDDAIRIYLDGELV